jgi:signal transduction histidine kinase
MDKFINNLQDVVYSYANGDFELRVPVDEKDTYFNVIASAINMLGEELQEKTISKDYFASILSKLPLPIVVYTEHGNVELINSSGLRFLNIKSSAVVENVFDFLPNTAFEHTHVLANSKKQEVVHFQFHRKKKHKENYYLCKIYKLKNAGIIQYIFIAEDITEIKQNEIIRMNAFLEGVENERKRIAYDLHDSLGQELNVINLFIEALRTMDKNTPEFDTYLERIKIQNVSSVQTLRDISSNIMPAYILENDVFVVIEQLVNNLNLVHKTSIKYKYPLCEIEIGSKDKELMLFRIVQEFLNNSIKHSRAKNITLKITINKKSKVFTFSLKDTGIGFDDNLLFHKNGLNNMIHRLDLLNAPYELISKPTVGTILNFKYYV